MGQGRHTLRSISDPVYLQAYRLTEALFQSRFIARLTELIV